MSTPGLLRCEGSGVEWNQTLLLRSAWINPTYRNCLSRHGTTWAPPANQIPRVGVFSICQNPNAHLSHLSILPENMLFTCSSHAVVVLVVLLIQGLNSDSFTADLRLIARPVLSGRRFRPWGRSSATGPMPWGWRLQSDWKEGLFSEKSHVCNEEHLGPLLYIYIYFYSNTSRDTFQTHLDAYIFWIFLDDVRHFCEGWHVEDLKIHPIWGPTSLKPTAVAASPQQSVQRLHGLYCYPSVQPLNNLQWLAFIIFTFVQVQIIRNHQRSSEARSHREICWWIPGCA